MQEKVDENNNEQHQINNKTYYELMNEEAQDIETINENIKLYFKKGKRDYDEFDNILLQMTMYALQGNGISEEQVGKLPEILDLFNKRATRGEFPASKFIVYLKFAFTVAQDKNVLEALVKHGFDVIYDKLQWLDKTEALHVAFMLNVPYLKKLLDKVAIDFLQSEYEDIHINFYNLMQAMIIFQTAKY